MDLLSLPDEILATVCKYTDFKTSQNARRCNTRIKEVFNRYHIVTLDIFVMWITFLRDGKITVEWQEDEFRVLKKIVLHHVQVQDTFNNILQMCSKKTRSIKSIVINNYRVDELYLDEKMISLLRNKCLKRFHTHNVYFKLDHSQQLKEFLHNFKFDDFEHARSYHRPHSKYTLSDNVISGISFNSLKWGRPTGITIDGLYRLCAVNVPKELDVNSSYIDLTGIANVLKVLSQKMGAKWIELMAVSYIHWEFRSTIRETMSLEEIEHIFRELKLFKKVCAMKDNTDNSHNGIVISLATENCSVRMEYNMKICMKRWW